MAFSFAHGRRQGLVWWLVSCALAAPTTVHGDNEFAAEGQISVGVSDRSDAALDDGMLDNVDAFTLIRPALAFSRSRPRAEHVARYTLSTRLHLRRSQHNALSNRLDWRSQIETSPKGELDIDADVLQSHTRAYELLFPRDAEPFPTGDVYFVRAGAAQRYSHRLSRAWEVGQLAQAGLYYPIRSDVDLAHSYQAGAGLQLQRHFRHESITGALHARYVSLSRPHIDGLDLPTSDRHVVAGAEITGSRALSPRWSADLGAGAVAISHVEAPAEPLVRPTALAALRYALRSGSASLSYRYDTDTYLTSAETSAMHLIQLSGRIPLRAADDVWITGALGYRRGRILDTRDASSFGSREVVVADAELSWEFRRGFIASARAQAYQQVREGTGTSFVSEQSRNQVMVSLSARFPESERMPFPPGLTAQRGADD